MRDGWKTVALGDIGTRRKDFTSVAPAEMYRIVGVQRSGWGLVDREPIRGDSMKFDKLMRLGENDLVYRVITAFEAPSAVVGGSFDGAYVTPQTFPVFKLDTNEILPGYMKLLTTSPTFHEAMASRCVGTVLRRKTLSPKAFESIPIVLPSRSKQGRIVDLVASIDDAIHAADEEVEMLRRLRRAYGEREFELRSRSRISQLGPVSTGATPKTGVEDYWDGGDIPFVTPGDISRDGVPVGATSRTVTRAGVDAAKRELAPYAVVQVCIGASVGKVGYVERPSLANQQVNALQLNTERDAEYVSLVLSSPSAQRILTAVAGHTTMPIVNKSAWCEIEVPWPDTETRTAVTRVTLALRDATERSLETAESLRALRSDLLTVLLSGEHEIPDSYDVFLEEELA